MKKKPKPPRKPKTTTPMLERELLPHDTEKALQFWQEVAEELKTEQTVIHIKP